MTNKAIKRPGEGKSRIELAGELERLKRHRDEIAESEKGLVLENDKLLQDNEHLTAGVKRLTISLAGAKGSVERQHTDIKRLRAERDEYRATLKALDADKMERYRAALESISTGWEHVDAQWQAEVAREALQDKEPVTDEKGQTE